MPIDLSRRSLLGTQSAELEPWCLVSAVNGQDAALRAPGLRSRSRRREHKPSHSHPSCLLHWTLVFKARLRTPLCASQAERHACWDKHWLQCSRPYSTQPFNPDWKAILGISILCFLNLCEAGLQQMLSICWDVGSSAHLLQTELDLQPNPWQGGPGSGEGCPRGWPQDHSAITPAVCQNPRCPSWASGFHYSKKWGAYRSHRVFHWRSQTSWDH